ncbi:hypothetical protein A2110_00080 [Candidatus Jorgensenbacteria bacterium GWA1_54_12]|uniref:DOD-type homing endonuclease domain-containing protein n=1 Tax=Candidatus Jorgensenbacteria bacterium GWA1_54_12 TaxID=1798468 RepID=A0A1F6BIG7_9BACT|nr:MAG: hypothetical protein A2110_00080 [Candidatus Jorgensenbacteria bacterium GWA1_54_12]
MLLQLLPKTDPRFKKWKESLKKRPPPWCAGFTKDTHPSVAKISDTFKRKGIDNFAKWRRKHKPPYTSLVKNGDLAELIGVIWGDGSIHEFQRTEGLDIASNSENKGFIRRYRSLVKRVFGKGPALYKSKKSQCIHIRIYEKYISKRLGIPTGNRGKKSIIVPSWIDRKREYVIRFLRGLYEAEGSFNIHLPTCTYKFIFTNRNKSLLNAVEKRLKRLGFHPHYSWYKMQLSRKNEVFACKKLIKFREY